MTTKDARDKMKPYFTKGDNTMNISYMLGLNQLGAFAMVAVVLAIILTVLAFIFIVPEKRREKLNAFGKFLHDTCNFKYLVVEKLLQALYIFATIYFILIGFSMLFQSPYGHWMGGIGIVIMIVLPLVLRLVYELLMMIVILVKNVIAINKKLKDQNDGTSVSNLFTTPDMSEMRAPLKQPKAEPVQNNTPVHTAPTEANKPLFCTKCGTPLDESGHCPKCK